MAANIIGVVISAITTFFTQIGTSLVGLFDSMVMNGSDLTTLATWGLVFIGLGFSIGVVKLIFRKLA